MPKRHANCLMSIEPLDKCQLQLLIHNAETLNSFIGNYITLKSLKNLWNSGKLGRTSNLCFLDAGWLLAIDLDTMSMFIQIPIDIETMFMAIGRNTLYSYIFLNGGQIRQLQRLPLPLHIQIKIKYWTLYLDLDLQHKP